MNIQFNRPRKLAHYGEKKENIQINFYSKFYLIQDHKFCFSLNVPTWS